MMEIKEVIYLQEYFHKKIKETLICSPDVIPANAGMQKCLEIIEPASGFPLRSGRDDESIRSSFKSLVLIQR